MGEEEGDGRGRGRVTRGTGARLAPHYLAFVQIAAIITWLRTLGDRPDM
jgi:hypothetical protein